MPLQPCNKFLSLSNTTVVAIFLNVCLWRRSLCSKTWKVLTLKNCIEPPFRRSSHLNHKNTPSPRVGDCQNQEHSKIIGPSFGGNLRTHMHHMKCLCWAIRTQGFHTCNLPGAALVAVFLGLSNSQKNYSGFMVLNYFSALNNNEFLDFR